MPSKTEIFCTNTWRIQTLNSSCNIAKSMGIETQNVFVLQDGDVWKLNQKKHSLSDQVHSGTILLEGGSEISATSSLPQDRKRLANKGAISISIVVDAETLSLINHPELTNIGLWMKLISLK
ncbi:MAG: hypothetical protein CM1200mP38_0940 [Dehalococcoidia bacterium]|nr:MAG: hypothetical protein CM1200mP38_0940 [Dehalococcoidia bacterium]